MQTKLTPGPLLDAKGHLCQAGYATQLVRTYERKAIKANALRIKEWDYYYVGNDHFGVALTIADNSYMGLDSVSLLDFDTGFQHTNSPMRIMTLGKTGFPSTSREGDVSIAGKGYRIAFEKRGSQRHLTAHMDNFCEGKPIDIDLMLTDHEQDTMVIATPFPEKPKAFYYNQKINCMPAQGTAVFDGRTYTFSQGDAMGVLDWGRGVWTYSNTWYWGSASGWVNGKPFGFNIGYGFGDTSAASENMLFYANKAHKLSQVTFNIPLKEDGTEDYMKPWTFNSDDGRFELSFEPIMDRASNTQVGPIGSDQHQVFGRFGGQVILDDGTPLVISDLTGFAEKVKNRW